MQASRWIAAWIMAMSGLVAIANAQSAHAPAKVASASTQQPGVLADAPELRAKLLEWEQYAPRDVMEEIITLRNGSAADRGKAAIRLGGMGPRANGAILTLIETFNDRTELEWRSMQSLTPQSYTSPAKEAAEALGKIGKDAIEPVSQALKDKDSNIRLYAAMSLGKIGDKSAVEPLTQALKDKDSDVRWYAADSLGKIGGKSAVEALIRALKDNDPTVRRSVALALGETGDESAVEPLIQALKYDDYAVRTQAADSLGKIGGKVAIEALNQALKNKDDDVRIRVALALGETHDESAVEPLTQALKYPLIDVRALAAESLGKIGGRSAVEALIRALKDDDPTVRRSVALALGATGDESAIEPLTQALKYDPGDMDAFQDALQKIHLRHLAKARGIGPRKAWEELLPLGILVLLFGVVGLGRFVFLKIRRART